MFPRSLVRVNRVVSQRASRMLVTRAFTTGAGKQGFASMDPQKQREVANKGGQTSHAQSASTNATQRDFSKAQAPAASGYTVNPNRGSLPKRNIVREPEKIEFKAGDLVRFNQGANMTLGVVKAIHTQPVRDEVGRTHNGTPENPMAEIQNHYTKHTVFHHLTALHWLANAEEAPKAFREDVEEVVGPISTQPPSARERAATHSTIREVPESTLADKAQARAQTTRQAQAQTPPIAKPTQAQAQQAQAQAQPLQQTSQGYKRSDTSAELNSPTSPLNVDLAPGDIVRFNVGRNISAGVVQEIYFSTHHDENGNFHGATRENPMARIENLWTKKIIYHHLNVLELVQEAGAANGRYAEVKYEQAPGPQGETFFDASEAATATSAPTSHTTTHTNARR